MTIKKGSRVKVEYTGKLEDGTVFDQTKDKPLEFVMGEGKLIKAFEAGMDGLCLNDTKTIVCPPEEAYGHRDETLLRKVNRNALPADFDLKKGMALKLHLPNGAAIPAEVMDFNDTEIVVDLNHPLAGKKLIFDIKVVGIE